MASVAEEVSQSIQSLRHVQFFAIPWTAAFQAFLSITNSQSLLKCMSFKSVMPSNNLISSSVVPFSCFQPFPALGYFLMSQLFTSGGQRIGASASASILPMNIQGLWPFELTGWISLLSKRFSRVFSSTTMQKQKFFSAQPSL